MNPSRRLWYGSLDATASVAEGAGAMVQRLSTNVGKGEAMKRGFEYAMGHAYDYVLTMDGDGQHAPADIQNFVPVLGQYDLILGMRMLSGPKFWRQTSGRQRGKEKPGKYVPGLQITD